MRSFRYERFPVHREVAGGGPIHFCCRWENTMKDLRISFAHLLGGLILAGVLVGVAGCGGPRKARIYGKITLDGQAVDNGTIGFIPVEGKGTPASTQIDKEGKYQLDVPVGRMRVEIHSEKVIGKKKVMNTPDSPTIDVKDEVIPDRYHRASTLFREVKAREEMNFELRTRE
jgi:hypothetical protein